MCVLSCKRRASGLSAMGTVAIAPALLFATPPAPVAQAASGQPGEKAGKDGAEPAESRLAVKGAGRASARQKIAVDPRTGAIRQAAAAQDRAIEARVILNNSTEGLEAIVHPGGMASVDLQGRLQSTMIVTVSPEGSPSFHCVTDPKQATALVSGGGSPGRPHRHDVATKPAAGASTGAAEER